MMSLNIFNLVLITFVFTISKFQMKIFITTYITEGFDNNYITILYLRRTFPKPCYFHFLIFRETV